MDAAPEQERTELLQADDALMSSVVTVNGALGSLTGGSCTGTGRGSSVGVSGASSAGSRSRGSESGLSGVFWDFCMHDVFARLIPEHERESAFSSSLFRTRRYGPEDRLMPCGFIESREQHGQFHVDQIDIRDAEDNVAVQHSASIENGVDDVEQRRLIGILGGPRLREQPVSGVLRFLAAGHYLLTK
jgi:hypothetical protein